MFAARRIFTQASPLVLCLGGLLFATHPIHTDSISSVVSRGEALSGLFAMLSFLLYASAFRSHDRIHVSYLRIGLSIFLAGIGTFCKEQCITVLAVNAAYDFAVVCELSVPTFLRHLWRFVSGSSSKAKTDAAPGVASSEADAQPPVHTSGSDVPTAEPAADSTALGSTVPPWFRWFLLRMVVLAAGIGLVLYIRLRQNHFKERFDSYSSRRSSTMTNLASQHCSGGAHQAVRVARADQGLLCHDACLAHRLSPHPLRRVGRPRVRLHDQRDRRSLSQHSHRQEHPRSTQPWHAGAGRGHSQAVARVAVFTRRPPRNARQAVHGRHVDAAAVAARCIVVFPDCMSRICSQRHVSGRGLFGGGAHLVCAERRILPAAHGAAGSLHVSGLE